jgi:hypothetical protein
MAASIDPAVEAALADVRRDDTDTNWALAGYESNTSIGLIGQGSGGVEVKPLNAAQILATNCVHRSLLST